MQSLGNKAVFRITVFGKMTYQYWNRLVMMKIINFDPEKNSFRVHLLNGLENLRFR